MSTRSHGSTASPSSSAPSSTRSVFVTTHWSVVLSAREKDSARSADALEALCRTYWYPLYVYVRRQGHSPHDAQDLTQEFFPRLLEKDYLDAADQQRGRFRTFLLVALKRFLANEWDKARAQKRGGGQQPISLDTELTEQRYTGEGSANLSADRIYERRWALTLVDPAIQHLREDYASQDKEMEFEHLKLCLTANRGEITYSNLASILAMSEGAARVGRPPAAQTFPDVVPRESRTNRGGCR